LLGRVHNRSDLSSGAIARLDDMDQELPRQSMERLARADIHEQWQRDYLGPDLDRYYDAAFARIVDGYLDLAVPLRDRKAAPSRQRASSNVDRQRHAE